LTTSLWPVPVTKDREVDVKSSPDTILPLKKISLELALACHGEGVQLNTEIRQQLDFIYGVASSGLAPFEFELSNRTIGDTFTVVLNPQKWQGHFGHLPVVWPTALPENCQRKVSVRVLAVDSPTQREVIQALAEGTACGDGCCGNH
jgi:hypothetical protein